MNLPPYPSLQSKKTKTAELQRLKRAINAFGYASISASFCEEHKIKVEDIAHQLEAYVQRGALVHSFSTEIYTESSAASLQSLPVGAAKKVIKEIIKRNRQDAKAKQTVRKT